MAFHGTFQRTPFAINGKNQQDLPFEATIAANFYTLLKRVEEGEKLVAFSQIIWPFQAIQGEPNFHVIIDDVGVFNFNQKLTNSPRIAQVGHVLRDSNLKQIAKLELAKKVTQFQQKIDLAAQEQAISDEEFIQKEIRGVVNAEFLQGVTKLLNRTSEFQVSEFSALESTYSFDNAIDFAQQFINTLAQIRGNKTRWDSLKKLIAEPITRWEADFTVQLKDIEERFKSLIEKAKELSESKIISKLDSAKDSADQWLVREQKNLIERIGKMYMGIDLILEDIRNKNKFFLNTDALKSFDINEVIQRAYQHIAQIRQSLMECEGKVQEFSNKMNKIRSEVANTSISAEERVTRMNAELMDKKSEQENKIRQLQIQKEKEISEIQNLVNGIQRVAKEIYDFIDQKINDCKLDEQTLHSWQIDDKQANIPASTMRFFMPFGIGIIRDREDEERIEIALPCTYSVKLNREHLSEGFLKLEKGLVKTLNKNMKIRSNFEFSIKRKSISNSESYRNAINRGFDLLMNMGLIEINQKQLGVKGLEQLK